MAHDPVQSVADTQRCRLTVGGIVQGVGFRPFVYRLAHELALSGWVRNDGGSVTLELEGSGTAIAAFDRRLLAEAPPLARIDRVERQPLPPTGRPGFVIAASRGGDAGAAIGPDSAVCPACLAELFDPDDRRYRYPFINCTDCGPRYTLVRGLPYDRAMTSMAAFPQCPDCLAEYTDPLHRRFHAEPNACPDCGPSLTFCGEDGQPLPGDPVAATLAALAEGRIVAIKGLGGFHLACDARNAAAVARLRARKHRAGKPLAVMAAGCASLSGVATVDAAARAALTSPERPIVLLPKTAATDTALAGIAPGVAWLGAMLPYTPLHYLLFHEAAGRPQGLAWLEQAPSLLLVMTSANPHGEPLVTDNDDALGRLAGIADRWLLHDRAIVTRCDDSVVRPRRGALQFLRRGRGHTPTAIALAAGGAPVLALGGYFNTTCCVVAGERAFVSQHVGDLDRPAVCLALEQGAAHLLRLLEVTPACIAHDLHPDFYSTRLAREMAERLGVPTVAVQHHHAHIAAVLAEHGIETPTLGLALDGVGLGTDGTPWGGELLRVDGARCERLGRLRPIGLAGGDRAAREPWRMAAAALYLLGRGDEIAVRFAGEPAAGMLPQLLARGVPQTSSMGRWFDAAAGLLGVSARLRFEGEAAMLLEGLAERHGPAAVPADAYTIDPVAGVGWQLDLSPLLAALADQTDAAAGAALFHAALVPALADWVRRAAAQTGIRRVACGGGCFLNVPLASGLRARLAADGIDMLEAAAVPPGDGGLSLGQAWVARHADW